jgi:uncharacterized damage-inducible protein DinB
MQDFQPDQARFLLHGVLLPGVKSEQRITKAVIDAIPAEQSGYRPDNVSKTALDLAWHIAVTEMRFMDAVASGAFDLSPRSRPESIQTPADLTAWYTDQFQSHFDALTKLSNDQLIQKIDFRGLVQLPAVMFLSLMMHHSVHHRGQLSVYLRPMGAKVPAIYGESHDSAEAKKAAKGA